MRGVSRSQNFHDNSTAIIQLVGDMKENIQQLINSISCKCGASAHIRAILTTYCNKIHKLRAQRDQYKAKCYQLSQKYQALGCAPTRSNHTLQSLSSGLETQGNLFHMMQKQFVVPLSLLSSQGLELQQESHFSLELQQNPEDSLLLTQSSCHRLQNQKRNVPKQPLVKSFEQFLLQKVQKNHTKQKICQDLAVLATRNIKNKSPRRRPLADRQMSVIN